ncbi:MAG: biopolymer transporter ExbD [Candidatus Aminicenantes bacterium]|nr:biopolymer transporter ExbD [Candidatus Aminicenantes bacterium]
MVLPKLGSLRSKREIGTSLSEINVTPFIDVMLVLLIIFMVTTPMMQSGIGVNLPTAETDNAPAEDGLRLTITPDKYIHIGESIINVNLLEQRILNYFAGKPKKVVFLQADKDLPYGYIMEIMDLVKKAGVEVVGLMTEPKEVKDKE